MKNTNNQLGNASPSLGWKQYGYLMGLRRRNQTETGLASMSQDSDGLTRLNRAMQVQKYRDILDGDTGPDKK